MPNFTRPRVVITGLGAITPLGLTVKEFWDGLISGRSGITRITQFDPNNLPCQVAGEIKGFEAKNYMDVKESRRISRSSQLAIAASREALADAGLNGGLPDPERTAVIYGTAIGGLEKFDEGTQVFRKQGYARVSPFSDLKT